MIFVSIKTHGGTYKLPIFRLTEGEVVIGTTTSTTKNHHYIQNMVWSIQKALGLHVWFGPPPPLGDWPFFKLLPLLSVVLPVYSISFKCVATLHALMLLFLSECYLKVLNLWPCNHKLCSTVWKLPKLDNKTRPVIIYCVKPSQVFKCGGSSLVSSERHPRCHYWSRSS